jgi:hypothetical protein
VLRKRLTEANARRMEIEAEIEDAVREKLDQLEALDTPGQPRHFTRMAISRSPPMLPRCKS